MASFIPTAEVARRLDMSRNAFYRRRKVLETEHGFPEPLPGFRNPQLYNAHAVTAWLANFRAGATVIMPPRPPGAAEVQAMLQRIGGVQNVHLLKMARTAH